MTVLDDKNSIFDVPYSGYQYPLPPRWKYAIRQQDQINYLLQLILALNDESLSQTELTNGLAAAEQNLKEYADSQDLLVKAEIYKDIDTINAVIKQLITGAYYTRNPVTGEFSPIYTALKQMYDILRVKSMTYDELASTGMTYDELNATGYSWFDVDVQANILFGDGASQVKFTPDDHIDELTPGYLLSGTYVTADTWGEMSTYGFLTTERSA